MRETARGVAPPERQSTPKRGATEPPENLAEHPARRISWEVRSYYTRGILAGIVGASAIALFFFAIDLVRGEPFRTPGVLGSALFLGEPLPEGSAPEPAVVAGYSAVHGFAFVGFGVMAAYWLATNRRGPGFRAGLWVGAVLFAAFELGFLAFAWLLATLGSGPLPTLGLAAVTASNAIAAAVMTALLVRTAPQSAAARLDDPADPE